MNTLRENIIQYKYNSLTKMLLIGFGLDGCGRCAGSFEARASSDTGRDLT